MSKLLPFAVSLPLILLGASSALAQSDVRSFDLVGEGGRPAGNVMLTEAPRGLLIRVTAIGLAPGWHGMHFHSVATCSDPGFKASGGHVHEMNAASSIHGLLNAAATDLGDLPNVYANADGEVDAEIFAPDVSIGKAPHRLNLLDTDGSALVIHAAADDHQSQPIGGAGARVACAAIK